MIRRARLVAVVLVIAAGALGVISSTQTWLVVTLADGAHHELAVPGAAAIAVLAPLSLALLALGLALAIAGLVLRYVFGALTVAIAVVLGVLTWQVVAAYPTAAIASTVTEATGIAGEAALADLVADVSATPWPVVTLLTWTALLIAGVFILATAHRWPRSGRRYRTDETRTERAASRPHDAIDDWDDLSRGSDPTA